MSAQVPDDRTSPRRSPQQSAWLVAAVLAFALFAYFALRVPRSDDGSRHPLVGRSLAEVALQPLQSKKELTLGDLKGRVTLINFWGVWCGPCRVELPEIAAIYQRFRQREDFQLLAVSCGTDGDAQLEPLRETTREYLDRQKLDLPTFTDQGMWTRGQIAMLAGSDRFEGYPMTLVVGRDGVVRGVWLGYTRGAEKDMARLVERLLADTDD